MRARPGVAGDDASASLARCAWTQAMVVRILRGRLGDCGRGRGEARGRSSRRSPGAAAGRLRSLSDIDAAVSLADDVDPLTARLEGLRALTSHLGLGR